MDWNYLRTFLAVAETGSLARAAAQLGISHATAFRHVRAFENGLGTRLFEKVRGRYELTETGEDILDLARTVAVAVEDIDRRGSGADVQLKGRRRAVFPVISCPDISPDFVRLFRTSRSTS